MAGMKSITKSTSDSHRKAISQIVATWLQCLEGLKGARRSRPDDQSVAGHMVGTILQLEDEEFEQLLDAEPLLVETFDAVGRLETPLVPKRDRPKEWAHVTKTVAKLEKKYLPTHPVSHLES